MAEKKVPSFEENLEKLESIVKKLETGEVQVFAHSPAFAVGGIIIKEHILTVKHI